MFLGTKVSLVIGLFRMTGSNIDKVTELLNCWSYLFSAWHYMSSWVCVCSKLSWVTGVKGDFLSQCLRMFFAHSLALPLFTWSQGFDTSALFFFFFLAAFFTCSLLSHPRQSRLQNFSIPFCLRNKCTILNSVK